MQTENKQVSTEWGDWGVWVHVNAPTAWNIDLLVNMAWEHGAVNVAQHNRGSITAKFWYDDKADSYAAEVVTYTNQQAWLETLSEEEAAELSIVL